MATVINEFQGTQIFVTPEGKFFAKIGDHDVTRTSIAALKKEILKMVQPVKGFTTGRYVGDRVEEVMVASIEKSRSYRIQFRTADRELRDGQVYHWDADLFAKLERNREERNAALKRLEEEFQQLMQGARRITSESLEAERAQQAKLEV